jgi:hypothetical protein
MIPLVLVTTQKLFYDVAQAGLPGLPNMEVCGK